MTTETTAATAPAKEPKGFKRKEAFRITQKNWNAETNTIDMKATTEEIAKAIGVNFGGAKSYFAFFAKEEHRDFIIPGLKTYWETELKGTRVNGTKKTGETKDNAGDGGTVLKTDGGTKAKGGSKETRNKLSEVLKSRQAKGATDKLAAALKAAHPEKDTSAPAAVETETKVAA